MFFWVEQEGLKIGHRREPFTPRFGNNSAAGNQLGPLKDS